MSTFDDKKERRVVPRWRQALATVAAGDFLPFVPDGTGERQLPSMASLERRMEEWRRNPTVAFASDAVGVAVAIGRPGQAHDAARFILEHETEATLAAKRLARVALDLETTEETETDSSPESMGQTIRKLRGRLREGPRNSLAWIDLARSYLVIGQTDQAVKSMRRALALEPDNRFALRSAARLYVHRREPEEALRVLRKSERTKTDPWLLASEAAVATILGRSPKFIKNAKAAIGSRSIDPKHTSELASALATLKLLDGSQREARKLFRHAMLAPNDNSIAQIEWASRQLPSFTIPKELLTRPRTFEARAWEAYRKQNWLESFNEAVRWQDDEPFSSRPAWMGTFVGSVFVQDYVRVEEMARRALLARPIDFALRNNLVFTLASANNLEKASQEAAAMPAKLLVDERNRAVWKATLGLLAFRTGSIEEGRALYNKTIAHLSEMDDRDGLAYAAAFLAREELRAATPHALEALQRASHLAAQTSSEPLRALIGQLTGPSQTS